VTPTFLSSFSLSLSCFLLFLKHTWSLKVKLFKEL
jgi:hypothetical protein